MYDTNLLQISGGMHVPNFVKMVVIWIYPYTTGATDGALQLELDSRAHTRSTCIACASCC